MLKLDISRLAQKGVAISVINRLYVLWHVCSNFRSCGMKDATEISRSEPSYMQAQYEERDGGERTTVSGAR